MDEQELLRTVPIFAELTDVDIASLSRLATRRRYPKDTVVFFENEEGDFFFSTPATHLEAVEGVARSCGQGAVLHTGDYCLPRAGRDCGQQTHAQSGGQNGGHHMGSPSHTVSSSAGTSMRPTGGATMGV